MERDAAIPSRIFAFRRQPIHREHATPRILPAPTRSTHSLKPHSILAILTALVSGAALAADSAQATFRVSLTGEKAVAQLKGIQNPSDNAEKPN